MNKRTIKDWIIATRPWSFPASVMPVIVAIAYTFYTNGTDETIHWMFGLLAVVAIIMLHAGGNLISDYHDFKKGVDHEGAVCVQTIVSGQFTPIEVFRFGYSLLLIGAAIGLYLVLFHFGYKLLMFGLFGTACALGYYFFKYRAFGDLLIFLAFAPMAMLGTGVVLTGEINPMLAVLSLPIGFITVGILHANNTLDIETDTQIGIKTVASVIGVRNSILYYESLLMGALAFTLILIALGVIPYTCLLAIVGTFVPVKKCIKLMSQARENRSALKGLDASTAQLQMAYSLLMSLGFVSYIIITIIKNLLSR